MTPTEQHRVLELEAGIAQTLMRAGREFLTTQWLTQPEEAASLRAHMNAAAEIRVEIVFGAHPHIRMVTVDTQGEDVALLRRLDMALPQAEH